MITGEAAWLPDESNRAHGYQCHGTGGDDAIVQGTQVTVTVDGDTLGIADLSVGESTEAGCELTFECPSSDRRGLLRHRGRQQLPGVLELRGADLERDDWTVELTL